MGNNTPLVSIITCSFNQEKYIEENIQSVINAGHENIEHIIIDGKSTDNTIQILKKYKHLNWVSEKDNGQTEALNKGFKKATGEIIGWLNSDDCYYNKAIGYAVNYFLEHPEVDFIFGNMGLIDEETDITYIHDPIDFDIDSELNHGNIITQPTIFFRKKVLDRVGLLNETLHYTMDVDYWIRIYYAGFNIKKVPKTLAFFRMHDGSKTVSEGSFFWDELRATCRYYGSRFFNDMLALEQHKCYPYKFLKQAQRYFKEIKKDKRIRIKYFGKLRYDQ